MRDNKFTFLVVMLMMLVSGIWLGVLNERFRQEKEQGRVTVRCDTVIRVDSIYIEKPVVRDSIVTLYVTRYLPMAKTEVDTSGTVAETCGYARGTEVKEIVSHSNGGIGYSQSQDSVNVILPIEQRKYSSDQYTAWVSGYEARLDSIALYAKEVVVEKEIYLDKKRRRWGCVVGAGVGVNDKGVLPYVGITVGYRLF